MKKTLMIFLTLAFALSLNAQDRSRAERFREKYPWKYEFRIGYGGYPLMDTEAHLNSYGCNACYELAQRYPDLGNMYSPKIKNEYVTGVFSAEFSVHIKHWLTLAMNMGVNGMWRTMSDPLAAGQTYVKRGASFNLIPTVRFQYVNSKVVRLYSGVGLGLYVGFFDGEVLATPAAQLTPIGISLGRKVFFFAETSVSTASMGGNMGIGFRF